MLDVVSITSMVFLCFLGFKSPRKSGWAVLIIVPFIGPSSFTFVPSTLLNLTAYRAAFAVTVGIILSNRSHKGVKLSSILKSPFVKIVVAFSLYVIILSVGDRLENLLFTYVPNLILAFVLCFILIKDEKDLKRLVKIFVWQGAAIGALIMMEYFTDFNFNVIALRTVPEADMFRMTSKGFNYAERFGYYRCAGIDGNAVQTGFRLAFLFPLTLWYATKSKLWHKVPLVCVIAGLVFLQTRAAFVGVIVSLSGLFFLLILRRRIYSSLVRAGMTMLFILALLMVVFPASLDAVYSFFNQYVVAKYLDRDEFQVKADRIPVALDYIAKKPFLGYGSPQYAANYVMLGRDLPAPFIYLLAGGIPLGLIFLFMIFYFPYSAFRLSGRKGLNPHQREFFVCACAAFVGGVIVEFSNWQGGHFLIMYMLYISLYKVYLYRGRSLAKK